MVFGSDGSKKLATIYDIIMMEPICLQCRVPSLTVNNSLIYVRKLAKSQTHLLNGHGHYMWYHGLLCPVSDNLNKICHSFFSNV